MMARVSFNITHRASDASDRKLEAPNTGCLGDDDDGFIDT